MEVCRQVPGLQPEKQHSLDIEEAKTLLFLSRTLTKPSGLFIVF